MLLYFLYAIVYDDMLYATVVCECGIPDASHMIQLAFVEDVGRHMEDGIPECHGVVSVLGCHNTDGIRTYDLIKDTGIHEYAVGLGTQGRQQYCKTEYEYFFQHNFESDFITYVVVYRVNQQVQFACKHINNV